MILKIQNSIPKLMYFVIITTIIVTTFSLSKYESAIAVSSDVTVASFVVNATGSEIDKLSIDCNSETPTISYGVIVSNQKDNSISQVAIKYDLIVEFSEGLPTGITISDGTTILNSVDGQTSYVFSDIGNFNAGVEKSNTHTITLNGSNEVLTAYDGTMSFYVDATQID